MRAKLAEFVDLSAEVKHSFYRSGGMEAESWRS